MKNNKINKNTNILIIGGASDLGRLIAKNFSKNHQCRIIIVDLNLEQAKQTARELESFGSITGVYQCDLSNERHLNDIILNIQITYTNIDILINNTGIIESRLFTDTKVEQNQRIMSINYLAPISIIMKLLPNMIEKRKGHIVNISSIYGLTPNVSMSPYCSSQAALVGFHNALRLELKYLKYDFINLSIVCAGSTGKLQGPRYFQCGNLNYIAEEIYKGIKAQRNEIIIKWWFKQMILVSKLLPVGMVDKIIIFFQNTKKMDIQKQKQKCE